VREYSSSSAALTETEVRTMIDMGRPSRPLISISLQRRRYTFGAKVTFHDRETEQFLCDLRPKRDPAYDSRIKETQVGVQVGSSSFSGKREYAMQTEAGLPVSFAIQCTMDKDYDAVTAGRAPVLQLDALDAALGSNEIRNPTLQPSEATSAATDAAAAAFASFDDEDDGAAPMTNAQLQLLISESVLLATSLEMGGLEPVVAGKHRKNKDSMLSRLVEFTQRVLPICEYSLSQNETLDIYSNDLGGSSSGRGDDDAEHKNIREERQFMDLELSQNKLIPSVEWHPTTGQSLLSAAAPKLAFLDRVSERRMPRTSHVLLYTLGEFVSQIVLELPADSTCMSWNPGNANLVAVGCITGQVCFFDMSAALAQLSSASGNAKSRPGLLPDEGSSSSSAEARAPRVLPKAVSSVEGGHSKSVVALRWMKLTHHISPRGSFAEEKESTAASQFMTVGGDGQVSIWDTRYKEKELAKMGAKSKGPKKGPGGKKAVEEDGPEMLESQLVPGAGGIIAPPPEISWQPLYKVSLKLGMQPFNVVAASLPTSENPADPILVASEGGLIAVADWAPVGEGTNRDKWSDSSSSSGQKKVKKDDDDDAPSGKSDAAGGGGGGSRMLWISPEAERSAVALKRHPSGSLTTVFMVVSDFTFSVWRAGTSNALFVSSPSQALYTAASWSNTRPAVVFLCRADGVLDVWDLIESAVKPVDSFTLVSVPLTSVSLRTQYVTKSGEKDKQLLAVGDAKGSLHILNVPFKLKKGPSNESQLLEAFLDREAQRVSYSASRQAIQDAEKAKKVAKLAAQAAQKEALQQKHDAELQAAKAALMEKEPQAAQKLDYSALEARKQKAARDAAEAAFKQLQDAVMAELGVKEADIVPLSSKFDSATVSGASSVTATPAHTRKPSVQIGGTTKH